MEVCFAFIFLVIVVIGWLIQKSSSGGSGYNPPTRKNNDTAYLDAIFILDAAENGVFVPGAEKIFDELDREDEQDYVDNNDQQYDQDDRN